MQVGRISARIAALGVVMVMINPLGATEAFASSKSRNTSAHANVRAIQAGMASAHRGYPGKGKLAGYARSGGGGLQCVPFARENTGIELAGNASAWWSAADGIYQRGAKPEVGSILNFRANGRMRMGHVAVVSDVVNGRTIEIDHANWGGPGGHRGGVSRNITVVDVSPGNDWTAVRVALGGSGDFGSVYPTYGFIYDRPDTGTMVANASTAPLPVLNAPPRDLRPASERMDASMATDAEEVAEADDEPAPRATRRYVSHHGRPATGKATVQKTRTTGTAATHKHGTSKHRT